MRKIISLIFLPLLTLCLSLSIFFGFSAPVYAATHISSDISTDTTWNLAGSPYIIDNDIYISGASVVTLTINAGVIVKFTPGSTFIMDQGGKIIANGTSSNKIYFTSLLDDTIGGDTNGDGGATTPDYSDTSTNVWFGINVSNLSELPTASLTFSNVVVRYANCGLSIGHILDINITNSTFEHNTKGICDNGQTNVHLTNSTIKNNNKGIWLNQADTSLVNSIYTVSGLSIYSNSVYGVQNTTPTSLGLKWTQPLFWLTYFSQAQYALASFDYKIDLRNTWWGDTSGPFNTTSTTPNPSGLGNKVSDLVLFSPWTTTDPAYPTPYSTPYSTPYATPYSTPYATPYSTPYATPYSTPYATPAAGGAGLVPYSTPYTTPYTTPYSTPYVTPVDTTNNTNNTNNPVAIDNSANTVTTTPPPVNNIEVAKPVPVKAEGAPIVAKSNTENKPTENKQVAIKTASKQNKQLANIVPKKPVPPGNTDLVASAIVSGAGNNFWMFVLLLIGLGLALLSLVYFGIYRKHSLSYKKYFRYFQINKRN